MKLLLSIITFLIFFSCSKEKNIIINKNTSVLSLDSADFVMVNGEKHLVDSPIVCTSCMTGQNGKFWYYIQLDSEYLYMGGNYLVNYSIGFSILDTAEKTYNLSGSDTTYAVSSFTFKKYNTPSVNAGSGSITITNNLNGLISGYFSGTFYDINSPYYNSMDSVSGVFNNIKIH